MSNGLWDTKDLVGIDAVGDEKPIEYLGQRMCYSRKDSKVRYDWLIQTLYELGLDQYAPQAPSVADAFRRACEDIPKGHIIDQDTDKKYKISMIRIDESAEPILRNIQLTEVDKREKTSTDGKLIAQIKFTRETQIFELRYGYNAGYDFSECPDFVRERLEAARDRFYEEKDLISDQQLNGIIHRILVSIGNPIQDIPSTWNVPATRENILDKLVEFSERLNNEIAPKIFNIDVLPVVNKGNTREKFSADAVAFAVSKLNTVLREQQNNIAFANDESQKDKYKAIFRTESEKVMGLISEYEMLLGEALDEVHQAKAITDKNLSEFCASPTQQAERRSAVEENNKRSRRIRKAKTSAQTSNNDIGSSIMTGSEPTRRIRSMETMQAIA